MSGVIPQVAALMGPCAAGTAYIPGPRRLRADGQGPRLDGARRPAPRARGGRRGRHAGGARRLARALPQVGRRRPRGGRRRGVHRAHQAVPLVHAAATASRRRRSGRVSDPIDRARRGAARRAAGVQPQALRHVRGDPPDRRRRRVLRHQAAVGEDDHHLLRALRRAARAGSSPTSPSSSAGSSTTTPPTRPRASSTSATRSAIPLVFLQDVPGLHGRHEGRGGGDHPPRREDALRGRQRDRPEDHGRDRARPTAPATT